MPRDHRHPTEVKRDGLTRTTLANCPQLRALVREHGSMAVLGAAVLLADHLPGPTAQISKDRSHAATAR